MLKIHAPKSEHYHEMTQGESSPYGQRYIIEGLVRTPDARNPLIRAVWFVEVGEDTPRFVTAYPFRREADDERIGNNRSDN